MRFKLLVLSLFFSLSGCVHVDDYYEIKAKGVVTEVEHGRHCREASSSLTLVPDENIKLRVDSFYSSIILVVELENGAYFKFTDANVRTLVDGEEMGFDIEIGDFSKGIDSIANPVIVPFSHKLTPEPHGSDWAGFGTYQSIIRFPNSIPEEFIVKLPPAEIDGQQVTLPELIIASRTSVYIDAPCIR